MSAMMIVANSSVVVVLHETLDSHAESLGLSRAVSPVLGENSSNQGKPKMKTTQNQRRNTANEDDHAII